MTAITAVVSESRNHLRNQPRRLGQLGAIAPGSFSSHLVLTASSGGTSPAQNCGSQGAGAAFCQQFTRRAWGLRVQEVLEARDCCPSCVVAESEHTNQLHTGSPRDLPMSTHPLSALTPATAAIQGKTLSVGADCSEHRIQGYTAASACTGGHTHTRKLRRYNEI